MNVLNEMVENLSAEFGITVGDASLFVGLQIERNRVDKKMFVHQKLYTKRILDRFEMNNVKAVCVTADPNAILEPIDSNCMYMSAESDNKPYRE